MTRAKEHEITEILHAVEAGTDGARDRLFAAVYEELRGIARSFMAKERADHTLQPTAVVHEAYIRLFGTERPRWENRAHFFGAAARAMRRILIDHARRRLSHKRGGDRVRVTLPDVESPGDAHLEELLALDRALDELEARDRAMAEVVHLRYFAGLTVDQTAEALGISSRSVNRSWTAARAWLQRKIDGASTATAQSP